MKGNLKHGEHIMNIIIMGAAGFIGTNLVVMMAENTTDRITVVDEKKAFFSYYPQEVLSRVELIELAFNDKTNFDECTRNQDIVYHLISTNNPTTSNKEIGKELVDNILITVHLLESCVKNHVKKIVFLSSGGTVYGKEVSCPIDEISKTNPINTYGIQKLTIEKILYLYEHLYGLDYRIIRLSNPFGPFQRPNGRLGVVTTFIYNALHNKIVHVYGNGMVIRDYIYISDAISAILKIAGGDTRHHIYNVGSGKGTSIKKIVDIIRCELGLSVEVNYEKVRNVDVPENYLDVSRYEEEFGQIETISLISGMKKTAKFLESYDKQRD